jgi:two-component system, OmpR family, sensor histidine kinase KdpD
MNSLSRLAYPEAVTNDGGARLSRSPERPRSSARGRLKVFFGAAPGVGKTYTMLEAAHARAAEGVDVVVGYVEAHGRAQTERLLEGLEALPRKDAEHRGRPLAELDLDAALARRPALLLVDDLAHTNAPGGRHAKRWQDVLELIDAGIDVYTTVNVQHLESLNDVVARVTGVVVRETVPDAVLDRADEVELVDLPPDELLRRLREGDADGPERAAEHFFEKGNLIALRELALRRTAERVDEQMRGYMRAHGIDETWPVAERVLVCVGPSPMSGRLVRAARRMAASLRAPWFAVSVEPQAKGDLPPGAAEQVEAHLRLAESLGAQTATLAGAHVADEVVAYAHRHNVTKIVVGKPTHPRWRDLLYGSLVDDVIRKSGDVDVYVITGDEGDARPKAAGAPLEPAGARRWREYAWAAVAVVAATLAARAMVPREDRADVVMVYLFAVVVASFRLRRGPSTFAALSSIAAFDFFFVPPVLTLAVVDLRHVITFATMLLVALSVSSLAHRVRGQAEAAREREQRTASLYAASRDFAGTTGRAAIARAAERHVHDLFGGEALIVAPDEAGRLGPLAAAAAASSSFWGEKERGVARWAFEHRRPAGRGTDTLPSAEALYVPLVASRGSVGVLGLRPPAGLPPTDPARRRQLEALASQTALALERALLVEEAQIAQLAVERERLRTALLSSVSHDLRTPLASITGASSTLLDDGRALPDDVARDLQQTIYQEAARLNRLVSNLLDMTRVTAGAVAVKKEWQPLEEPVGAALTRLEGELRGRPVETRLPRDLPLVPIDAVLVEQVFVNLLENAVKYSPPGSPVAVGAFAGDGAITAYVDDRGPGVPAADAQRVFEMFFRGDRAKGSGTGLGLAICHGLVAAHGGRIWVEPVAGGGASFRFTLPLDGPAEPAPAPPDEPSDEAPPDEAPRPESAPPATATAP